MALAGRRAMPQISGIANRLSGMGHCQKKKTIVDPLPLPPISQEDHHQGLMPEICKAMEEEPRKQRELNLVLLGRPGAGKGTFGIKLAALLDVPHISTGDLIREEMKKVSSMSRRIAEVVSKGKLLGDEEVFELLHSRLQAGAARGDKGFILDGFPRTVNQAIVLDKIADVHVAVNFAQEREVLIQKCLGRRVCGECGRVFSMADVSVGDLRMPAIPPPIQCLDKMVTRKDDSEQSIQKRLQVYDEESKPVEDFYRKQGKLVNFDVRGGVSESWPKLLQALNLVEEQQRSSARTPPPAIPTVWC
ncbi:adenylate kinase [Selaginella moellendorffii]|nr:adenylate kinase [Selaginella moellendorffii]|eukprot:XP_002992707.2 adenylate kinase [Selaginella moellendorffii]